jgi:cell division protein FtsI (penicillin-binding protein 3)
MASNVKLSQTVNLKGKPVASALTLPDDAGNKTDLLKTLQNMSLKHEIVSKPDDEWTFTRARNDTVFVVSRNIGDKKRIPSVVGMGLKDALFLLENRGLRVRFSGYGKVITQSLTPGNEVTRGQEISIRLD